MRQSEPQGPRALRAAANRAPVAPARARAETGKRISRRHAWITDPHALLRALEQAERAEQVSRADALPVADAIPRVAAPEPAPSESRMCAPPPPALRADERIGRASSEGVLVIVRRRRAA